MPISQPHRDRNRPAWMATLSQSIPQYLVDCVQSLGPLPDYQRLRPPETGLTMVRGRAGGTGQVFNLGEMTVTRCVVVLSQEPEDLTGFGYVAGRNRQHAELAALCDALLQHPDWYPKVYEHVIVPLQAAATARQAQTQREAAATQVDFFTLLRGE